VKTKGFNVDTSAEKISDFNTGRVTLIVQNLDASNAVHIGFNNTVSATTGYRISAGGTLTINNPRIQDEIWGIAITSAVDIVIMEG